MMPAYLATLMYCSLADMFVIICVFVSGNLYIRHELSLYT
jgi:hypothetical protein